MNNEKVRKLKYITIFILDIIIFIFAVILLIIYKRNIINEYTTILLSLICLISTKLTSILRKRTDKFYSKYDINIRENKKR